VEADPSDFFLFDTETGTLNIDYVSLFRKAQVDGAQTYKVKIELTDQNEKI
jgi:hypothetical protein